MRIETVCTLDELEPCWEEIDHRAGALPVFQSWSWNAQWARTVIPQLRGARLHCHVVLSDAGRVLAILPCFRRPVLGGAMTITQWLGSRMSFVNDVITAAPDDDDLGGEMAARLRGLLQPREILHLKHMSPESAFARALIRNGQAELQCRRLLVTRVNGDGDPMSWLSRKHRRTLRWQANRLAKRFGACRYRVVPLEESEAAFERFVRLHHLRFSERSGTTLLEGPNLDFLRTVFLSLCRQRKAEILELQAGTQSIAALLNIPDGTHYYSINSGFDTGFEPYSPMKLLLTEAMRRALNDLRCEYFELGSGYEEYKRMWRPQHRQSFTAYVRGPGLIARAAAVGYRAAFRRATAVGRPVQPAFGQRDTSRSRTGRAEPRPGSRR